MDTGARWGITMITDELLTLTQWLSPAFPLGSFAYSHGLETAITEGQVTSADTLQAWLETVISRGTGWTDALLVCAAKRGEDMTALTRALAGSRERLEESEAQGAALATTLRAMGHAVPEAPLPVVLGTAVRGFQTETDKILALYLQNFATNLVQIAVRFVPLGQSEGQRVLASLQPVSAATARRAAAHSD